MAAAEMALAVSRVLSQGYQMHPDAFALLSELSANGNVESILKSVIQKKESVKADRVIQKNDFDDFVPSDHIKDRGVIDSADFLPDVMIMSDPTGSIAPVEAEAGFKRLFQDRYSHLLEITRERPDSKN